MGQVQRIWTENAKIGQNGTGAKNLDGQWKIGNNGPGAKNLDGKWKLGENGIGAKNLDGKWKIGNNRPGAIWTKEQEDFDFIGLVFHQICPSVHLSVHPSSPSVNFSPPS